MDPRTVTRTDPLRRPEGEGGAVLVVVVLVMVAMFGVGHALLLAVRLELFAAKAGARQLEARAAAETAVERALAEGGGSWMDGVATWQAAARPPLAIGALEAEVGWRRVSPEAWLVEGAARGVGRPAAEAARLAWVLDPLERVLAWPGVIGSTPGAPRDVLGIVETHHAAAVDPPLDPALCPISSGAATGRLAAVAAFHELPPGQLRPALGRLDFDTLLALAAPHVDSVGSPGPIETAGACVDAPWSWGDPDRPYRPCGSHLPLRGRVGDLHVEGGVGQGILVVDGSVVLTAGARYHGVVLVTGRLELHDGSALAGYALAPAGVFVSADSRVIGSACRALRALDAGGSRLRFALPLEEPVGPL